MKKALVFVAAVFISISAVFAKDDAIAVPAPKSVNLSAEEAWIPLFVQGTISQNFQKYSGLTVIDRQNEDLVKAEQKLGENPIYSDEDALELGNLTHARYIITGSITQKSSAYALMFSITDAQTGEAKASASVPNCLPSALENGDAANKISYDLMTGYGIKLSAEATNALTKAAQVMTSENSAQLSLAKGIIAENNNSNLEALTYYIQAKKKDRKLSEAENRFSGMTTRVTTGNFGKNAKNLIKLRNEWDKLLEETTALIASNPPTYTLFYYSDITQGEIDYDKGIMDFKSSKPYIKQNNIEEFRENFILINKMKTALEKIPESKDWGKKINGFPWTYAEEMGGNNWMQMQMQEKEQQKKHNSLIRDLEYQLNYSYDFENERAFSYGVYPYRFDFSLLDSNQKVISKRDVVFFVSPNSYKDGNQYLYTHYYKEADERLGVYLRHDSNKRKRNGNKFFDYYDVAVEDADTENMSVSVRCTNGLSVSIAPAEKDVEITKGNFIYKGDKNAWVIEIPYGYESISPDSFKGCKYLRQVIIPTSLTKLDILAFKKNGNCVLCYMGSRSLFEEKVKWYGTSGDLFKDLKHNMKFDYIEEKAEK